MLKYCVHIWTLYLILSITQVLNATYKKQSIQPSKSGIVTVSQYPWVAAIVGYDWGFLSPKPIRNCTGTYIHEWWVLTAASCVIKDRMKRPPEPYYIIQVAMGGTAKIRVTLAGELVIHSGYVNQEFGSTRIFVYNLALVRLKTKFALSESIQVHNDWHKHGKNGCSNCVLGYGFGMKNEYGQYLQVLQFRKFYDEVRHVKSRFKDIFSLKREYICDGDIGAPLYHDGMQVGVASRLRKKTAAPYYCGPGRFVNIQDEMTKVWILCHLEGKEGSLPNYTYYRILT